MNDLIFIAQIDPQGLNTGGWAMMVLSISVVLALSTFCMYRMFRGPQPSQHHHAPLEIDTHDLDGEEEDES
jgi:hypothetical protein